MQRKKTAGIISYIRSKITSIPKISETAEKVTKENVIISVSRQVQSEFMYTMRNQEKPTLCAKFIQMQRNESEINNQRDDNIIFVCV